jgi:hypothetical protein
MRMDKQCPYVVAIRILNQSQRIISDLVDELDTLVIRGMIDTPLKNTTAMAVSSNLNTVGGDGIVDELGADEINTSLVRRVRLQFT